MRRGKVPGKNGITTDILKCAGDVAALQLVPLLMKCILHQYEPLSWKGGCLVPLFKGRAKLTLLRPIGPSLSRARHFTAVFVRGCWLLGKRR